MGGQRITPGERFGELVTVQMEYHTSKSGRSRSHWQCRCDCGGSILVDSGNLRNGNTTRCQACTSLAKGRAKTTHGHTRGGKTTKTYMAWQAMRARCNDPANKRYADYGGRGITIDPRWDEFEVFLADMGDLPFAGAQIDRIDNTLGYAPGNCKWSSRKEQGRNKRNNVLLTFNGETRTLAEWSERSGINYATLKKRIALGWSIEHALTVPSRGRGGAPHIH